MRYSAVILCALLGGCAVGPNYERPAPIATDDSRISEAENSTLVSGDDLPKNWWRLFNDPQLDLLVEKALEQNNDIRSARANVRAARAILSSSRAANLPSSDVNGSVVQQRLGGANAAAQPGGSSFEDDFYDVGFDASYEVDIFGGRKRQIEADRASFDASRAAADVARVTVVAETVRFYSSICSLGAQIDAAKETVRLLDRRLDLTRRLLVGGRGTRRDVDEVILLIEQARADIPQLDGERRAAQYALSVLTGEPPARTNSASKCRTAPTVAKPIPVGDGRSLLARRPDVRQAERTLASDTADIGVTTAALYPSISILGSVSLGGLDPSDLNDSGAFGYSIGPFLSWNFPLSGAARARVRQSEAIAEGSLAQFEQAILLALQETEQAIARLDGAVKREGALSKAYAASEGAVKISRLRYDYGADSFLDLIDAERNRSAALTAFVQSQSDRAAAQVALFRALGGGWEENE